MFGMSFQACVRVGSPIPRRAIESGNRLECKKIGEQSADENFCSAQPLTASLDHAIGLEKRADGKELPQGPTRPCCPRAAANTNPHEPRGSRGLLYVCFFFFFGSLKLRT